MLVDNRVAAHLEIKEFRGNIFDEKVREIHEKLSGEIEIFCKCLRKC